MIVLFYTTVKDRVGERFQREVVALVPENNREIHRTIESLSRRLRRPKDDLTIAVLLAASRKDLLDLLFMRDLLSGVRIILILPNREETTIAIGHKFHPRFLSYADSDFKDVAAVLRKMLGFIDSK